MKMRFAKSPRCFPMIVLLLTLMIPLSGVLLNAQDLDEGSVVLLDPEGDALFEDDPNFPECLGPEDPFCPAGFPSDGEGGGGGSFTCQYCDAEMLNGQMEFHCKDVGYGEEGWTECNDDGLGTECGVGGVGCGKV